MYVHVWLSVRASSYVLNLHTHHRTTRKYNEQRCQVVLARYSTVFAMRGCFAIHRICVCISAGPRATVRGAQPTVSDMGNTLGCTQDLLAKAVAMVKVRKRRCALCLWRAGIALCL